MTEPDIIAKHLKRFRLSINTEADLQASIAAALTEGGIEFVREFRLRRGPVDFFVGDVDVAIEAKIGGSPSAVAKQCVDYLDDERVAGLVLVTAKRTLGRMPGYYCGKPIAVVNLWRQLL